MGRVWRPGLRLGRQRSTLGKQFETVSRRNSSLSPIFYNPNMRCTCSTEAAGLERPSHCEAEQSPPLEKRLGLSESRQRPGKGSRIGEITAIGHDGRDQVLIHA